MIRSIGQVARKRALFSILGCATLLALAVVIDQSKVWSASPKPEPTDAIGKPTVAAPACKPADESLHDAQDEPMGSQIATSAGRRVILYDDGTWQFPKTIEKREIDSVTDTGQSVVLTEETDPNGCVVRKWTNVGISGGVIQVVVTRAITTDLSIHGNQDNCIPVIKVRNLNSSGLEKIIVETEFSAPDGTRSSISLMFNHLDNGEEQELASAALFVNSCRNLSGMVTVPYCVLYNDADCRKIVRASSRGLIPLVLGKDHDFTAPGRSKTEPPKD